ncbi:hypothetical protein DUNSADRAFT_4062 [Dunaliella salina]|uniref:Encoded protein n=1 Tax=Dunaliella salina TaxID=3046 RepID=A0ABQ7FV02_DUNSA|nr:hypothetical protein DUNSADRAFT_4062 [Dunaliella salina]|eukprot:KAF5826225.1 hypothetical protein DUNSADRAFT_4062 [Dunaliella salina]
MHLPSRRPFWLHRKDEELWVLMLGAIECTTAMRTWCLMLQTAHAYNGFATCATKHLRQLGPALQVWQQVEHESTSLSSLGLQPVIPGGFDGCPCCWRDCTALSLDACLGLRQLKNVASASTGLGSLLHGSFFVPESGVTAELQGQQADGLPSAHTEHSCAQFKAATHTGTRREHYKSMGIAAGCCRHGRILQAVACRPKRAQATMWCCWKDCSSPTMQRIAAKFQLSSWSLHANLVPLRSLLSDWRPRTQQQQQPLKQPSWPLDLGICFLTKPGATNYSTPSSWKVQARRMET